MIRLVRCRAAALFMLLLTTTAGADEISPTHPMTTTPILQLETGMHVANITAGSVDATGRLLLTASIDKTARLWSLPTSQLLTVFRPPQDLGREGQLFNAALSPDGTMAAVSGWTGTSWDEAFFIYIFDARTKRMMTRFSSEKQVLQYLTFSPDGKFLVASLASCCGFRVWQTKGWKIAGQDNAAGHVTGLSFDRSGRLVTASDDDIIRLYNSSFHLIGKVRGSQGDRPSHVGFTPDGSQIAITYPYATPNRVDVLAGRDLRHLFSLNADGTPPLPKLEDPGSLYRGFFQTMISSAAWSSDGRTLYVGGGVIGPNLYEQKKRDTDEMDEKSFLFSWPNGGRGARQDQWATGRSVASLIPLPGGGLVYTGLPPLWGTIGTAADVLKQGAIADFTSPNIDTFQLSADGRTIAFGLDFNHQHPIVMSLAEPALRSISELPSGLNAPLRSAPGTDVTGWLTQQPKLNGRRLDIDSNDTSAGVSVRNDTVLVGSVWGLHLFDRNGQLLWKRSNPAPTDEVNLSADGRLAVAGYDDGTIRWYRAKDGQELLAFFPAKDGQRWILWTPSGYYTASPDGEDLIGWTINRGPDQAADFFPASRFHDRMFRPDVVRLVLETLDENIALTQANAASGRTDPKVTPAVIATLAPPVLELVSAPERFNTDRVTIKFRVHSPADAPMVGDPRIKVNGEWQPTSRAAGQIAADDTRQVTIGPLPPRDISAEIYGDNIHNRSTPLTLSLKWDGRAALVPGQQGLEAQRKPRLFVLAIGISQYQRPDLRLNFAAHDAERFVAAMQTQSGKLYAQVIPKLIRDNEATLVGVKAGLDWFASQAAADDVGVLFLAGHGVQTPDQAYFYAPVDFDPSRQSATGVDYHAIRAALDKFSTSGNRVLFFVDTCYPGGALGSNLAASSGASFAEQLSRADSGVVVLSGSKGDQLSYESTQWQDGAFTKALLEGIVDAKADPAQSGEITVLDLGSYIHKRVLVLTERRQEPTLSIPPGGVSDFTVAAH